MFKLSEREIRQRFLDLHNLKNRLRGMQERQERYKGELREKRKREKALEKETEEKQRRAEKEKRILEKERKSEYRKKTNKWWKPRPRPYLIDY